MDPRYAAQDSGYSDQATPIHQLQDEPDSEPLSDFVQNTLDEIDYEDGMYDEQPPPRHPPQTPTYARPRHYQPIPGPSTGIKIPDVPRWSVYSEVKEPMTLSFLYILLSLPIFHRFVAKYIPWLTNVETGEQTVVSVFLKSVILAGLFWLIKKFLLN